MDDRIDSAHRVGHVLRILHILHSQTLAVKLQLSRVVTGPDEPAPPEPITTHHVAGMVSDLSGRAGDKGASRDHE
jgi:hypothetical protein